MTDRAIPDGPAAADPHTALYQRLESALAAQIGFKLLTVLRLDGPWLVRAHSSDLARYPAGGRKDIRGDAYLQQLLRDGVPVLSADAEAVRQRFFDHDTIFAMGCQSVLNLPVVAPGPPGSAGLPGRTLGTLNLLHQAHWFSPQHRAAAQPWVARLAQAWA